MATEIEDIKSIIQDGDVQNSNEGLVFNPFNKENKEITLNDVQSILKRYGIDAKVNNIASDNIDILVIIQKFYVILDSVF